MATNRTPINQIDYLDEIATSLANENYVGLLPLVNSDIEELEKKFTSFARSADADLCFLYELRSKLHFKLKNFNEAKTDLEIAFQHAPDIQEKTNIQRRFFTLAMNSSSKDIFESAISLQKILSSIENTDVLIIEQLKKIILALKNIDPDLKVEENEPLPRKPSLVIGILKGDNLFLENEEKSLIHISDDSPKSISAETNKSGRSDSAPSILDESLNHSQDQNTPDAKEDSEFIHFVTPLKVPTNEEKYDTLINTTKAKIFEKIIQEQPEETDKSPFSSSLEKKFSSPSSLDTPSPLSRFHFNSPLSPRSLNIPSFVSDKMGYSGRSQKMRTHMVTSTGKLDPCIYWEQKTGIGFCTLNLDHRAIRNKYHGNLKSLWDTYQEMILEHENPHIRNYPFDKWFKLYVDALPDDDVFKQHYLVNSAKGAFKIVRLDEKQKNLCELKFIDNRVWVHRDHPNKPYIVPVNVDKDQEWFPLDTTFLAKMDSEKVKAHLIDDAGTGSQRVKEMKMIYVKDITMNKCYVIFDQPGKIYHSTFVKVDFEQNSMQQQGVYDGGTLIVENGKIKEIANDSGHIRSSDENFLTLGLMQDILKHSAFFHLEKLTLCSLGLTNNNPEHIFDKDNHAKFNQTIYQGNQKILNYLTFKNLLPQETKIMDEKSKSPQSPSCRSFVSTHTPLRITPRDRKKKSVGKSHKNSLQLNYSMNLKKSAQICESIRARIEKLSKKVVQSSEMLFLKKILEHYQPGNEIGLKEALDKARYEMNIEIYTNLISRKYIKSLCKKINSLNRLTKHSQLINKIEKHLETLNKKHLKKNDNTLIEEIKFFQLILDRYHMDSTEQGLVRAFIFAKKNTSFNASSVTPSKSKSFFRNEKEKTHILLEEMNNLNKPNNILNLI